MSMSFSNIKPPPTSLEFVPESEEFKQLSVRSDVENIIPLIQT